MFLAVLTGSKSKVCFCSWTDDSRKSTDSSMEFEIGRIRAFAWHFCPLDIGYCFSVAKTLKVPCFV